MQVSACVWGLGTQTAHGQCVEEQEPLGSGVTEAWGKGLEVPEWAQDTPGRSCPSAKSSPGQTCRRILPVRNGGTVGVLGFTLVGS